MSYTAENLAEAVYHHRTRLGISQRELAERAHVSRHTIVNIEKGDASGVRFETASKVIEALGLEFRIATRILPSPEPDEDAQAARERFRRRFQKGGAISLGLLKTRE